MYSQQHRTTSNNSFKTFRWLSTRDGCIPNPKLWESNSSVFEGSQWWIQHRESSTVFGTPDMARACLQGTWWFPLCHHRPTQLAIRKARWSCAWSCPSSTPWDTCTSGMWPSAESPRTSAVAEREMLERSRKSRPAVMGHPVGLMFGWKHGTQKCLRHGKNGSTGFPRMAWEESWHIGAVLDRFKEMNLIYSSDTNFWLPTCSFSTLGEQFGQGVNQGQSSHM